jgi:hypothetical protein
VTLVIGVRGASDGVEAPSRAALEIVVCKPDTRV